MRTVICATIVKYHENIDLMVVGNEQNRSAIRTKKVTTTSYPHFDHRSFFFSAWSRGHLIFSVSNKYLYLSPSFGLEMNLICSLRSCSCDQKPTHSCCDLHSIWRLSKHFFPQGCHFFFRAKLNFFPCVNWAALDSDSNCLSLRAKFSPSLSSTLWQNGWP